MIYQFLATTVPSIALVYFFVTLDKFPEPKKIIIITFILGILITIPAGIFNTFLDKIIYNNLYYYDYYHEVKTLLVGPVVEEILKFLIILLYCSKLDDFDEPMDGLVYGATAALGFAMAENFHYVYNAENFGTSWQDIALLRAFLTAPMHASCGIFIGFSFSYYYFNNKNIIFLIIGLFTAIIFHFLYNYGFFGFIVTLQIIIIFFLFKNLRKRQDIIKNVWKD